jgi:ribosome biogenesis protein Nip4
VELTQVTSMILVASRRIDKATKEIYKMADKKAETERTYRIALAQKKLILKSEGMAISLIEDISRGDEEVAGLKFERDVAEDRFKAAIESLRALQAELSGLQTISRYQSEV